MRCVVVRGSAPCGALAQLRVATRGSRGAGHAVGAKDGRGACQHRDAPASQGGCPGLLPLVTWVTHRKPLRDGARVAGVAATAAVAVGQELETELEHSRKREAVLLADVQVLYGIAAGVLVPVSLRHSLVLNRCASRVLACPGLQARRAASADGGTRGTAQAGAARVGV